MHKCLYVKHLIYKSLIKLLTGPCSLLLTLKDLLKFNTFQERNMIFRLKLELYAFFLRKKKSVYRFIMILSITSYKEQL